MTGSADRRRRRGRAGERRELPDAHIRVAGLAAVRELFAVAPGRVERLLFTADQQGSVAGLCAELARARRPYRLVGAAELVRIAGTSMHGGVVAIAEPKPLLPFDPAEARIWAARGEGLLLLDGVGNPHNLGAIARTAAYFGLQRLVLSDHLGQARPSDAAHRIARGGLEHLTLYRASRMPATLRRLRESHYVIGTALEHARALDGLRTPPERPVALVLGNEEEGLPRETLRVCEAIVTIPGSGAMQSLNVAASAAILIHALLRPQRGAG